MPPPAFFLTQSAKAIEKKWVEFSVSAREYKRVRKNMKKKGIDRGKLDTEKP